MREILFKAKSKDNGEWIYGYPMRYPQAAQSEPYEPYWRMFVPPANPEDTGGLFEVDPDTLCQYTGLKDKNGNKIFEDDICIIRTNLIDEEDGNFRVYYDEDTSKFELIGFGIQVDFDIIYGEDCEVVGNIADNPGMLIDKIRSDHG